MKVEYIDHMGDDLAVVNAARVSHAKQSTWALPGQLRFEDESLIRYLGRGLQTGEYARLLNRIIDCNDADEAQTIFKKIRNIATHFAPFTHCIVKLRVTAPLAMARQLWKSHIGLANQDEPLGWSEMSMRYVEPDAIYSPKVWRKRAENVKQGSSDEAVAFDKYDQSFVDTFAHMAAEDYEGLIKAGVAPEQARLVLPMATETTWVWTGSLLAFSRIVKLRLDPHAQRETQEIAQQIEAIVQPLFPVSWEALS